MRTGLGHRSSRHSGMGSGWIPCLCGDRQSLTAVGDTAFSITKGPRHLFMVHLLDQAGGRIVLCILPNLSSDFVCWCGASTVIIVLCDLVCGMLQSCFHIL